jgi:hypothetical protein
VPHGDGISGCHELEGTVEGKGRSCSDAEP